MSLTLALRRRASPEPTVVHFAVAIERSASEILTLAHVTHIALIRSLLYERCSWCAGASRR